MRWCLAVFQWVAPSHTPAGSMWSPRCSTSSLTFGKVTFHFCQTSGYKLFSYFVILCISLMTNSLNIFLDAYESSLYFSSVEIKHVYSFKYKYIYIVYGMYVIYSHIFIYSYIHSQVFIEHSLLNISLDMRHIQCGKKYMWSQILHSWSLHSSVCSVRRERPKRCKMLSVIC